MILTEIHDQPLAEIVSENLWTPMGADDDFTALGVYGQYIFIDPDARTVIVKLSGHGTEQDEIDTVESLRVIAEQMAASAS
ncbi:MAG: hypothetical protein QM621_11735 [Aeromicrobium sp.]|uniref:hypothetical protein n=1 Tax=Aeromicrobium sp. TaxID=1871063 RepID=UPI0039E7106C